MYGLTWRSRPVAVCSRVGGCWSLAGCCACCCWGRYSRPRPTVSALSPDSCDQPANAADPSGPPLPAGDSSHETRPFARLPPAAAGAAAVAAVTPTADLVAAEIFQLRFQARDNVGQCPAVGPPPGVVRSDPRASAVGPAVAVRGGAHAQHPAPLPCPDGCCPAF